MSHELRTELHRRLQEIRASQEVKLFLELLEYQRQVETKLLRQASEPKEIFHSQGALNQLDSLERFLKSPLTQN
jgi:hypothetical protein